MMDEAVVACIYGVWVALVVAFAAWYTPAWFRKGGE